MIPPKTNPRVGEAQAPLILFLASVKSPKSFASPVCAIVIMEIVLLEDAPDLSVLQINPLVALDNPVGPDTF